MTTLEKLDPDEILRTAIRLRDRISERFPGSGLSGVAEQLIELASRARRTCAELARPNLRLRFATGAVIVLVIAAATGGTVVALTSADHGQGITWADLVQVAEAGANDLVLLGAAIYFFISFETRLKRSKVVKALHQLRTLAHLIDVHQLTKTPEILATDELRTKSSPERRLSAFELGRYLDYCTEMLSLTGKIAALYGDGFGDSESLEAVNEIEDLTIGLQRKIWQKLILLQSVGPAAVGKGAHGAVVGGRTSDPGSPRAPIDVPSTIERTMERAGAEASSGERAEALAAQKE